MHVPGRESNVEFQVRRPEHGRHLLNYAIQVADARAKVALFFLEEDIGIAIFLVRVTGGKRVKGELLRVEMHHGSSP